jgi:LCP family protein required for cell wall assembly
LVWIAVVSVLACVLALICAAAAFRPSVEQTPPFIDDNGEKMPGMQGEEKYRRKEGFYTFLVCGTDKVSNNTDVMMLVSVDRKTKEVNVLQIPRDTYINRENADFRVSRINSIYTAAYNLSKLTGTERKKAAMERLCTSVENSLCVTIDRYVLIDTSAFVGIIDAVGGIEYNVPFDMKYSDPAQNLYIDLEAGLQILDGKKAEQFIRYRSGYVTGDIGRVEARGDFLREVYTQVLEKISLKSAIDIAGELFSTVVTDAGVDDIAFFAKTFYDVGTGNINIKTLSGSSVMNPKTGVWTYYAINKRSALADINKYMNAYNTEISYELFDKAAIFTDDPNGENPYISEYYYAELNQN